MRTCVSFVTWMVQVLYQRTQVALDLLITYHLRMKNCSLKGMLIHFLCVRISLQLFLPEQDLHNNYWWFTSKWIIIDKIDINAVRKGRGGGRRQRTPKSAGGQKRRGRRRRKRRIWGCGELRGWRRLRMKRGSSERKGGGGDRESSKLMTFNYASRRSRTRDTVNLTVCVCVCVCVCGSVPAVTAQRLQCNETNSFYRLLAMFSWILIRGFAN